MLRQVLCGMPFRRSGLSWATTVDTPATQASAVSRVGPRLTPRTPAPVHRPPSPFPAAPRHMSSRPDTIV